MADEAKRPSLYAGLDEAGRGCVLGPMVIAIVSATPKERQWFAEIGVKDSKLLSPKKREDLAKRIRERCWYRLAIAQPFEIDEAVRADNRSLNTLEQDLMSSLIRAFQKTFGDSEARILSDAIGRYPEYHAKRLREMSMAIPHHTIISRIHADRLDKTVGASSIIAKSERERLLAELQATMNFDFGSGYAGDKKAIAFIKQCASDSPIVRWSWKMKGL
jgi:ribonuclease HII